jgi:hypothetical protein
MSLWGIGTALIGVTCYCIGLVHGLICGRLHHTIKPQELRHMEPVTRPMEAVERPVPQWEREMDETADQAWRNWA